MIIIGGEMEVKYGREVIVGGIRFPVISLITLIVAAIAPRLFVVVHLQNKGGNGYEGRFPGYSDDIAYGSQCRQGNRNDICTRLGACRDWWNTLGNKISPGLALYGIYTGMKAFVAAVFGE